MRIPDIPCGFYGTSIEEARFGPRRELTLTFVDMKRRPHSRVRFGGIVDLDEVRKHLEECSCESLHYLRYSPREPSKPGRLILEIEFDGRDERCVIRCSNLQVVLDGDPPTPAGPWDLATTEDPQGRSEG